MQGALTQVAGHLRNDGIIPAYGGGGGREHHRMGVERLLALGSSPRMRGAQVQCGVSLVA